MCAAKQSHNDTVSTHNRFQPLENLHTDDTAVLLQDTFPNDTYVKLVSSSPSNTYVSTKVAKVCNSLNKNYKQKCASRDQTRSDGATTVVSDKCKDQSLATVPNREADASIDTNHDALAVAYLEPPPSNVGFERTYANTAIPLPVWENRIHCMDYNLCVDQNGGVFGALPVTDQIVYQRSPTNNTPVTNILDLHEKIRHSQLPNLSYSSKRSIKSTRLEKIFV